MPFPRTKFQKHSWPNVLGAPNLSWPPQLNRSQHATALSAFQLINIIKVFTFINLSTIYTFYYALTAICSKELFIIAISILIPTITAMIENMANISFPVSRVISNLSPVVSNSSRLVWSNNAQNIVCTASQKLRRKLYIDTII